MWALYDGDFCQNKSCQNAGKSMATFAVKMTNEEYLKWLETPQIKPVPMSIIQAFQAAILCVVFASSCTFYQHEARSKSGAYERDIVMQFGGKTSQQGADGSSFTADNEASFQHFCQAVGVAVTGWASVARTQAQELSTRYAAGEISKQQATTAMKEIAITQSNNNTIIETAKLAAPQ